MSANIKYFKHLVNHLLNLNTSDEMEAALRRLLTPSEVVEIGKRQQIIDMLEEGVPQRKIAETLGVGIATVTRGSKYLKSLQKNRK